MELPVILEKDEGYKKIRVWYKSHPRFFHGYYDEYCYLPLYIFVGEHKEAMGDAMELAKKGYKENGCKQRVFKEIGYKT